MTTQDAHNYITEKNKLGSVPGLDNILELLERLGRPQDRCEVLHIAGTNGKGSIFSYVENVLIRAGYRVGRYISPTIFTYLERFQINKTYMPEDRLAEYVSVVSKKVDEMETAGLNSPTAFEIETAIALLYFADSDCDFVLIECGMGGRLDATNVFSNPLITAIAPIGYDHMQYLGDSIEDIAREKAGIIKPGACCISSAQTEAAECVIKERCRELGTEYITFSHSDIEIKRMDISGSEFWAFGNSYRISLLGEHQIENAVTALLILRQLQKKYELSEDCIKNGLLYTAWPGRLTKISEEPYIFVDGAHNVPAWLALRKSINKYFTNRRIIFIIGVLRDKEYEKMIDIFQAVMSHVIAITPDSPRALEADVLVRLLRERGISSDASDNADEALALAKERAKTDDVILVCGSLSFIGDYLSYGKN